MSSSDVDSIARTNRECISREILVQNARSHLTTVLLQGSLVRAELLSRREQLSREEPQPSQPHPFSVSGSAFEVYQVPQAALLQPLGLRMTAARLTRAMAVGLVESERLERRSRGEADANHPCRVRAWLHHDNETEDQHHHLELDGGELRLKVRQLGEKYANLKILERNARENLKVALENYMRTLSQDLGI